MLVNSNVTSDRNKYSLLPFLIHCRHIQYVTMVKTALFMKTLLLFESKDAHKNQAFISRKPEMNHMRT